jgi:hypothetical protein
MTRNTRRILSLVIVVAVVALRWALPAGTSAREGPAAGQAAGPAEGPAEAPREGQVEGRGVVQRVLPDDDDGSRHQRFILALDDGRTVLVAHNIDLAPRLTGLDRGDTVAFFGEYEPNPQGGVIHWTHRDPAGRHVAGWLKHEGRTVQ